MKLTKEYPHLQFVKESYDEADESREQVQFYGKINWTYIFYSTLLCNDLATKLPFEIALKKTK